MAHEQCSVCRGSKTIKLPLYREVSARFDPSTLAMMEETSRQYPCPECAPTASEDRVAIVKASAGVMIRHDSQGYEEHARKSLALSLADLFLRGGFIAFAKGEKDQWELSETLTATLGVVSPSIVASMEQRVSERQSEVAQEVAAAAAAGIRVWGSYYTGDDGSIQKSQAVDAVNEALKAVLEKRRRTTDRG